MTKSNQIALLAALAASEKETSSDSTARREPIRNVERVAIDPPTGFQDTVREIKFS